ncbi:MAG: aryl-alcohol dehydrogenase-like predicted oxidoreductase, partial [Limisphaerales bacterium]
DFSAEACEKSVERSLKRLQTDYLDIVLIHSDGSDLDILQNHGTLEVLLTLKKAGKIRAVGMSHKTVAGAELAIEQGADVLMATLNPGYTDELGVIEAAAQAGVGVLIKKALSSGHGQASDLAWVAEQSGVGSIVIGTTNLDHLEQNVRLLAV